MLGALFRDDFFHRAEIERLEVDHIGHFGIGLDGRDVRVDKDRPHPHLVEKMSEISDSENLVSQEYAK